MAKKSHRGKHLSKQKCEGEILNSMDNRQKLKNLMWEMLRILYLLMKLVQMKTISVARSVQDSSNHKRFNNSNGVDDAKRMA